MTVLIYILTDPRTGYVRYVGKTTNLSARICDHMRSTHGSHRAHWIADMKDAAVSPTVDIVEEIENSDDSDWQEAERFWIAYLRFIGSPLTNHDSGGNGGKKLSRDHRARISAGHTGKKYSDERRAQMSAVLKGRPNPKTGAALRGRTLTIEHRKAIALNSAHHTPTTAHIERLRAFQMGKKKTPESIQKRTITRKRNAIAKAIAVVLNQHPS